LYLDMYYSLIENLGSEIHSGDERILLIDSREGGKVDWDAVNNHIKSHEKVFGMRYFIIGLVFNPFLFREV
jgi:hypothetical protein